MPLSQPYPIPEEVLPATFVSKFYVDDNGCWIWTAAKRKGYAIYNTKVDGKKKTVTAHRFSFEVYKGVIPDGLQIDHMCEVTSCVNPEHLWAITAAENNSYGNSRSAVNARKTHCPQDHEYNEENTYYYENHRQCRACHRIWDARRSPRVTRKS